MDTDKSKKNLANQKDKYLFTPFLICVYLCPSVDKVSFSFQQKYV